MARVLLIDDDPGVLFTLRETLADRGHEPVTASSGAAGLARLDGVDLVVTDLAMPDQDGLAVLRAVRERDETLPVILLTAHGSERDAVAAMKAGAYDYQTKPFDIDELGLAVDRALEARGLRTRTRRLVAEQAIGRRVVGTAPAMRALLDAAARVAGRDVTVLVRGATGTGKELVAALLHAQSRRAARPLVRFNCAAIPAELAEAELFGHARGAFTGAHGARRGFFGEADGGTLVLDEVGELPLPVQAKLLRALQDGEVQPVGASRVERVDVRIVASTHRDLRAEARAGRFREDLYYRLAVVELRVPALAERREDIPELAREFARRYGDKFGVAPVELSPALLARLQTAPWPGNVRELENTVARMVALSTGGTLDAGALESEVSATESEEVRSSGLAAGSAEHGPSLREQVDAFERALVARTLAATGGNQSEAARRLAVSRGALIDKLRKYRLGGGTPA